MIVTLGALHGESKECSTDGIDLVRDGRNSVFLRDDAALVGVHAVAQESGGHLLHHTGVRQQIARHLLADKLVIRHVFLKGLDHPVPPRPHLTVVIHRVAIGICVTSHIQPIERKPLGKGVSSQQSVDGGRVSRLGVGYKGINFL